MGFAKDCPFYFDPTASSCVSASSFLCLCHSQVPLPNEPVEVPASSFGLHTNGSGAYLMVPFTKAESP